MRGFARGNSANRRASVARLMRPNSSRASRVNRISPCRANASANGTSRGCSRSAQQQSNASHATSITLRQCRYARGRPERLFAGLERFEAGWFITVMACFRSKPTTSTSSSSSAPFSLRPAAAR